MRIYYTNSHKVIIFEAVKCLICGNINAPMETCGSTCICGASLFDNGKMITKERRIPLL